MHSASIISIVFQDEYKFFLPSPEVIDIELENWKSAIMDGLVSNNSNLPETLDAAMTLFPNVYSILKVLLTMPVSTANAKRSFSVLKRLKTYLCNSMGDECLISLALLNIYRDKDMCVEKVLKYFDVTGHRRIAHVFDKCD